MFPQAIVGGEKHGNLGKDLNLNLGFARSLKLTRHIDIAGPSLMDDHTAPSAENLL